MDIKKVLKLNGILLAPDASAYLSKSFESSSPDIVRRFIDCVLASPVLVGNRVTKAFCEKILSEWRSDYGISEEVIFLVNALDVPRFSYCRNMKKFVPLGESAECLLPSSPLPRSLLLANRYENVYQRVIRNPLFDEKGFKLRSVEFLLSSGATVGLGGGFEETEGERTSGGKPPVIVLGFLVQLKNAEWYLEDPTNLVRLDLSHTRFHQGVFSEGSIVLAEGWYNEDTEMFQATGIGLPPVECASDTRRYFNVTNPFGGESLDAPAAPVDPRMSRLLNASPDAMLVLLGETRLDVPGCLEHLETLFMGYADFPPCIFLLCGDYISPDHSLNISEKRSLLKQLFRRLIEIFLRVYGDVEARGYRQPRLVLVPGPHDPCVGPQNIYPRPRLPLDLFGPEGRGKSHSNWLWLASNPCRLRVFTREIVVFRYDYGNHMLRHCIYLPTSSSNAPADAAMETAARKVDGELKQPSDIHGHDGAVDERYKDGENTPGDILGRSLARCLSSQAHLTPLPLHVSPVYWAYDQSLYLNPLPDLVVAVEPDAIADLNVASNSIQSGGEDPLGGCRFTNPGRFGDVEYNFKVYYPSNKLVEDSRLPS